MSASARTLSARFAGTVGAALDRLPVGLVEAVSLYLVLRVALGIVTGLVLLQGAGSPPCSTGNAVSDWKTFPPMDDRGILYGIVGVWQHADACWYSKVATFGYEAGTGSTNFFPLLPALMAVIGRLFGGDVALAGEIVSAIAFVAAFTGLRRLVEADVDGPTASRTLVYVAAFPVAFFLVGPFTESLFLACAVWAILGARRRQWALAGVAAALAALPRPPGIFLVLPIAWEGFCVLRAEWPAVSGRASSIVRLGIRPAIAAAAPAVAYLGYVGWTVVGTSQSYFASHRIWARTTLQLPWDPVIGGWQYAIAYGDPVTLLNTAFLVLFVVIAIAGLRSVPFSYSLYVLPQLAVLLTQQGVWPLISTARYLVVLFPCFVILARVGRRPGLHMAWLLPSGALLGYLAGQFVAGLFIG